jgi:hypothetical protein
MKHVRYFESHPYRSRVSMSLGNLPVISEPFFCRHWNFNRQVSTTNLKLEGISHCTPNEVFMEGLLMIALNPSLSIGRRLWNVLKDLAAIVSMCTYLFENVDASCKPLLSLWQTTVTFIVPAIYAQTQAQPTFLLHNKILWGFRSGDLTGHDTEPPRQKTMCWGAVVSVR